MKLKLPCYFNNEVTAEYESVIGDCPVDLCDVRDTIIYVKPIFMSQYFEKGKEVGTRLVFNENQSLLCVLKINEVEYLIK